MMAVSPILSEATQLSCSGYFRYVSNRRRFTRDLKSSHSISGDATSGLGRGMSNAGGETCAVGDPVVWICVCAHQHVDPSVWFVAWGREEKGGAVD